MPGTITMQADTRLFSQALNEFGKYSARMASEILPDQANKLVSNGFAGGGGLYQEARKEAPATRAEIEALAIKLNYRIKRAKGVTVAQEIQRRLKNAGYVQSTGWLSRRYKGKNKEALRHVTTPRGQVRECLNGDDAFIEITNTTPGAGKFAERTGYVTRALNNRIADMLVYVRRKLGERIGNVFKKVA